MPEWEPLNRPRLQRYPIGTPLLVVRHDGKGYYGTMSLVTADYLELTNGQHKHMIRFGDPANFTVVDPPRRRIPEMAERQLFKS